MGSFSWLLGSWLQVFPAVVAFYEHTCRADRMQTTWGQKLKRYAPFWVLTGFYLLGRAALMGGLIPTVKRASLPWGRTILSSFALFNDYMNKLVWPGHAALFDTFHPSAGITDWQVLCGAAWASLPEAGPGGGPVGFCAAINEMATSTTPAIPFVPN